MKRARSRLRPLGVVLLVAGVGVAAAQYLAVRVPTFLQGMEVFKVDDVAFEGVRFADVEDLRARLELTDEASIWDDVEVWKERLEMDPIVTTATIRRDLPSTLVVEIEEAEPVALIATPTLEPIDRRGELLPIDPAQHRLDLPVLRASLDPGSPEFRSSNDLRSLLEEWVHLRDMLPSFSGRVSQVGLDERGAVEVTMFAPAVTLRYRPPASMRHLQESALVLKDARERRPESRRIEVDMRFGDRIVVRYPEARYPNVRRTDVRGG